ATCHWQAATRFALELPSTALPLGLFPDSENVERTFLLQADDVLVCYSDGVTEALSPSGKLFAWAGLEETLALAHRAPAAIIRQMILQSIDAHRGPQAVGDDLTLLVVKRADPRPETTALGFVFSADVRQLKQLDSLLHTALGSWVADSALDTWRHELSLALTEHLANIIRHAYARQPGGRTYGVLTREANQVVLETLDTGLPFDMQRMPPRSATVRDALRLDVGELPENGYGLPLIRTVMDEVDYERLSPGRNYWRLARYKP
ncbi:MAG: ATP-binding SpoIIE family protein phosphatase, partial [Anaerolineales bacterium]